MKQWYNKSMQLWDVCPLENGYIELYYNPETKLLAWYGKRNDGKRWVGAFEDITLERVLETSKNAYDYAASIMR